MPDLYSAEHLAARRAALLRQDGFAGVDATNPQGPSGHAYAVAVSTRLTSEFRRSHRPGAMNVTPSEVVEVLISAGVKQWVLMGLHGYVGFLPEPRATQDVDVMVPYSQKGAAVKALLERWPELQVRELSQVIRFRDPGDLDAEGQPRPVLDLMLPWSSFQREILAKHVMVDAATGHRLPTLEAAIVSKYAPLVSPHRSWDRKQQDAVDLRRIIRANYDKIDRQTVRELGDHVWEQGGEELIAFLEIALEDKPFPI